MSWKKILVVDDAKSTVDLITLKLIAEGFEVVSAQNGVEAIEKTKSEKPLVIVMDVIMPEMSGFEALERLRDIPETRHIPVIIMSARAGMKDFFENISAVEFMLKPLNLDLLTRRLEALTAGARPPKVQPLMRLDANVYFQNISEERVSFDILKRSPECKAVKFICNSLSPEDWSWVLSLVRSEERIVPFFGIHPLYASADKAGWDNELVHILINHHGAGIGAIGLDGSVKGDDYTKQVKVFLRQLKIAEQLSRPVAICCVQAWDDLLVLLREHKPPRVRFMVCDYQGSPLILEQLSGLNAFISFSRKALNEAAASTVELVRKVPKNKLLLETDFPCAGAQKSEARISAEIYFEWLRETYDLAAQAAGTGRAALEKTLWDNGHMFLYGGLPASHFG